jgi:HprK-related kinase A
VREFTEHLRRVYASFPMTPASDFSDIHVDIRHPKGLRALIRPQAVFAVDGTMPFEPYPAHSAMPLFEWGVNWYIARRMNQYLLLHAGVVADAGRGVVLAALPGSGKSTLTAALMLEGYRLLSDEFGAVDLASGSLASVLKPVALKNESIAIIRALSPHACFGPTFPNTRKGDVAHLAPSEPSVLLRTQAARPALILFPKYERSAPLSLRLVTPAQAFARLAFNSFNYQTLGFEAFHAVSDLANACPAFELGYSGLDEAIGAIRRLLADEAGPAALPA